MICALLFFAITINYIDRQVPELLSKDLQLAFGWSEIDSGNIVAAFNAAYVLGLLLAGRLTDFVQVHDAGGAGWNYHRRLLGHRTQTG